MLSQHNFSGRRGKKKKALSKGPRLPGAGSPGRGQGRCPSPGRGSPLRPAPAAHSCGPPRRTARPPRPRTPRSRPAAGQRQVAGRARGAPPRDRGRCGTGRGSERCSRSGAGRGVGSEGRHPHRRRALTKGKRSAGPLHSPPFPRRLAAALSRAHPRLLPAATSDAPHPPATLGPTSPGRSPYRRAAAERRRQPGGRGPCALPPRCPWSALPAARPATPPPAPPPLPAPPPPAVGRPRAAGRGSAGAGLGGRPERVQRRGGVGPVRRTMAGGTRAGSTSERSRELRAAGVCACGRARGQRGDVPRRNNRCTQTRLQESATVPIQTAWCLANRIYFEAICPTRNKHAVAKGRMYFSYRTSHAFYSCI